MNDTPIIEIPASDSFETAAAKVNLQADVILLLFGAVDQALVVLKSDRYSKTCCGAGCAFAKCARNDR